MFPELGYSTHSFNCEHGLHFQWPIIIATSDQHEQEPISPRLPVGENEQLLDINGLLEIEQLIRGIKEDGRLKHTDIENKDFIGIPPNDRINND